MEQLNKIKESIKHRPFLFSFVFIAYILLNLFLNKTYITLPGILNNLGFGIPFLLFGIFIPLLVAINVNLIFCKVDEMRMINKGTLAIGAFIGLIGGTCPGCYVGLFPAVLGLFGISASLSIFPLYGFEIQAISAILLTLSTYYLTRNHVCKVK